MLALVVELLVTALTGAAIGFEATSFFVDEGNRPRLGQAFLVVDPGRAGGPRDLPRARRDAGRRDDARRRRAPARRAARRAGGGRGDATGIEIPQALADALAPLTGGAAQQRRAAVVH